MHLGTIRCAVPSCHSLSFLLGQLPCQPYTGEVHCDCRKWRRLSLPLLLSYTDALYYLKTWHKSKMLRDVNEGNPGNTREDMWFELLFLASVLFRFADFHISLLCVQPSLNKNSEHNLELVIFQSSHSYNLKCGLRGERPLNKLLIHEDNFKIYSR